MSRKTIIIFLLSISSLVSHAQEDIFIDTKLKALIAEAVENNSDFLSAGLNVGQAEAMLQATKLTYLPSFAFDPSANANNPLGGASSRSYSLPLSMQWELSLGGKEQGEKQVAQAQFVQAVEQLRYVKVQLAVSVTNAYYTLVMLDRQKAITQESIINQEATLQAIQAMKDAGRMDEIAVNQADSRLQATYISLTELELQISKVETALSLLLNRQAGTVERSSWQEVQPLRFDYTEPIELHRLSQRPDVLIAEQSLVMTCGNLTIAKADFYPTLRISVDGGWSDYLGAAVDPGKVISNLIGSLTQPLFQRKKLKARKKVAELQLQQAQIAFEKALLTAGGEVKDALDECRNANRKLPLRNKQVEAAETAYKNSMLMLRYSQTLTYIDVLTAQDALLTARLQQSADFLEYQQALINLYKALCLEN